MLRVLLLSLSALTAEAVVSVGHHLPGLSASDAETVAISCVFLGTWCHFNNSYGLLNPVLM